MMTRTLYDSVDMERYRRHFPLQHWEQRNLNTALELSHSDRLQMRSAPIHCRPERMPEPDQDSNGSQTRRQRIAVACARCRKRKIKCSGDPGNGLGCQNCRNAGSGACNFFRVGSHDVGPPALNGLQQPPNSGLNGYGVPSSIDRMGYVQVPPGYGYSSRGYPHAPIPLSITTRNLTPSDYGLQYDSDSPTDNYGLQTAPLTAHDTYTGYDIPNYSGRAWTHPGQRIPTAYSHYAEQEASAGYSTSLPNYAPSMPIRQPLSASDNGSSFNVVALQYSLPNAVDRRLPNPMPNGTSQQQSYAATSNMNAMAHRANALGISGLQSHHNLSAAYTSKSQQSAWVPENGQEAPRSDSIPSMSSNADLIAPPPSKASTTASSSTASESKSPSYINNGTSPEESPTNPIQTYNTTASSNYSSASSTRSLISSGSGHSLHGSQSHPDFSTVARQNSQANLYSYSREPAPRAMEELDRDGEGTLVNGERYQPLDQPRADRSHIDARRHREIREAHQLQHRASLQSIQSPS
ncbi:hypothetical protein EJ08DRAFT_280598 [Tothia fuscella]|uniref:Zn(2)-C6 fungal-type domain-containing protein n=1 Tax=Tothia fuscella TaxID=1048955 RepID=A0A9P4TXD0_9PEZI|nr:hypothetical protein EJ08DRAFT_280598 [Tothia fuscella]